jgi:signal transduction histidine kinase/CheY-like chemotaxis protein
MAVLCVSLVAALGLSSLAFVINNRDSHHLLHLEATNATVAITSETSQILATMASVGWVAASTNGSEATLQKAATEEDGISIFSAVAAVHVKGSQIEQVIPVEGHPSITPSMSQLPEATRGPLQAAMQAGGLRVLGFQGEGSSRLLLVALGAPAVPPGWVIYGEVQMPEGITVPSPFPKLNFAVYAGATRSGPVIFASTKRLPLGGDRVDEIVDMSTSAVVANPPPGDPVLLFEVTPTSSLLSTPALALPWLLFGAALLMGILMVLALESAARRRDQAIEAADDLRQKNQELDEAMAKSLAAEKARQQMEAELTQAQRVEAVGQLAGGIAHDFNNLLMVIQTHANFLTESLPEDESVQSDLGEIRQATRRAAELTRRLLVFSRRDLVRPLPLDVNANITDVINLLRRSVGEDVSLELIKGEGIPAVLCDPGELNQVMVNLVVNARQAIDASGSITVSTEVVDIDEAATRAHSDLRPGRFVQVSVTDTGCGMDPETMAHVFEPYFTTKEEGSGTGLGLYTVYAIVRRYGGCTSVDSVKGLGSTVSVLLPATERVPVPEPETAPSVSVGPASDRRKVLLVEDEDGVRKACLRILEGAGYDVLQASSAGEALDRFRDAPFDLMVTDVVMPGNLSGRDLVREMHRERPDLPVLYMTGYSKDAIAKRGVLDEGVSVIDKPFSPGDLLTKVGELLAAGPARN